MFLEEIQTGIHQQHDQDDEKVFPLLHQGGEQGCNLDHPWDRPPETAKDAVPKGFFPLLDLVVAVLTEAFGDLCLAQPLFDIAGE